MRPVNTKHLPRLADLNAVEKARQDIELKAGEDERSKFIDENSSTYSNLRESLWHLGSLKCWYSEALLQQQQGHVEHFRPKKKVATVKHGGYWWDAFDWTNLRLAHPTVNLRVTDYLTGKKAGKGTYFPLKNPDMRASDKANEIFEEPLLLDPTKPRDCRLLCFDLSSGKPIPSFTKEQDEWKFQRADQSIDFYHLDEATWTMLRKDLIDETAAICNELVAVAATVPRNDDRYEELVTVLVERTGHSAEFSSVALQVLQEKGVLDAIVPAQPG